MNSSHFTSELLALSQMLEEQADNSGKKVGGEDHNFHVVCDELLTKIRDHVVKSRQGSYGVATQSDDAQPVANQAVSPLDVREFGYL
jgi:hypothetical protein